MHGGRGVATRWASFADKGKIMDSIRQLFAPGGKKFYTLFRQTADNLGEMTQVFYKFVMETDDAILRELLQQLEDLEHANDQTTHKLIIELGRNFITPFDREDIHALATTLDDVADYMYAIAKQRITYRIAEVPAETKKVVECLKNVVKLLQEILNDLNDKKNLIKLSVLSDEAQRLLNECDQVIDMGVSSLMLRNGDIKETIKFTDHFKYVQLLADKCGDSANVIDSIIIKYS